LRAPAAGLGCATLTGMGTSRQRSPAEILDEAASLQRRLTRSLDDWDAGDQDALRDVAGYSRTLLAFGKGDGLLRRLVSMYALELPPVYTFSQPDVGGGVALSVGGLVADAPDDDTNELSLDEWLRADVVVATSARRRRTDWAQFVTDYGNTFGAHVAPSIPESLEQVKVFRGPNGHMGGYILRAAAVVAERLLGEALLSLDSGSAIAPRSAHPDGVVVTGFAIAQREPMWHAFGVNVSVQGNFEVIRMPYNGGHLSVSWKWDGGSKGGSFTFNFDAGDS